MEVKIRIANLDDLPILEEFLQELIAVERPMDPSLEQVKFIKYYELASFIESATSELYVATVNNEIVGSGYGDIRKNKAHFAHTEYGYVGFMFVKENFRGLGISTKVLEAIFEWFLSKGIKETRLTVYQENPSAIRAYEKVGYKKNLIEMLHYIE